MITLSSWQNESRMSKYFQQNDYKLNAICQISTHASTAWNAKHFFLQLGNLALNRWRFFFSCGFSLDIHEISFSRIQTVARSKTLVSLVRLALWTFDTSEKSGAITLVFAVLQLESDADKKKNRRSREQHTKKYTLHCLWLFFVSSSAILMSGIIERIERMFLRVAHFHNFYIYFEFVFLFLGHSFALKCWLLLILSGSLSLSFSVLLPSLVWLYDLPLARHRLLCIFHNFIFVCE